MNESTAATYFWDPVYRAVLELILYWSVIVVLAAAARWTITRIGGRHA